MPRARDWYTSLFGFDIEFDSDWFVHLRDRENPNLELGIMAVDHEVVTESMRAAPVGGLVTFVVESVDEVYSQALELGVEILDEPVDLFYGQRRMVIADPDGQLIDVSSACPVDPAWLATL